MIRSMTGFGRAQSSTEGYNITVEIRSVNHRFFEFSSRMPRNVAFLEEKVKNLLSKEISRGKVEFSLQLESTGDESVEVNVNEPLVNGYLTALNGMAEKYGLKNDASVMQIARFQDVLVISKAPVDEEDLWRKVETVTKEALLKFVEMRETEGEKLKQDVLSRAETILNNVSFIEERSPETVKQYTEKLLDRMKSVLGDVQIDESRILTEAAIFADKVAVAEETVRLRSHIDQLHAMFSGDEAIGRRLDFLIQEINREANTIGSKASDIEIARKVIDIKGEIEKIREQIQNIE
ncbi:MAG: YicC family protein [Oscillospiraceae bacterium]|nr:YicC family protein [Oscillospiraceae bacterium]